MDKRRDRISARQLGALALSAAGVPVFQYCCRIHWLWTLAGGAAAALTLSGLTLLLNRRGPAAGAGPRWLAGLTPLLVAGAAAAAWAGSFAFPETAGNLLAALLLFLLAAWAARLGPAAAGRCAGILLWVSGGLYGIVLLFSLPQIHVPWLRPGPGAPTDALRVWAALTLPGAGLCLRGALGEDQRLPCWPWWAAGLLAAGASAVTGGILSSALAGEPAAFRTLARGVSVLGVMRRFEALVNGAMLISAFCLCAMLLTAVAALTRNAKCEAQSAKCKMMEPGTDTKFPASST